MENRGGGGGAVGASEVARAAPDGYTILFAANAVSILHLAVKNLQYDTLRDFVPITQVTTQPNGSRCIRRCRRETSGSWWPRQGQSRQAVLRALGRGRRPAPDRRTAEEDGRHRHGRHPVQGRRPGDRGPRRRPGAGRHRWASTPLHPAPHAGRITHHRASPRWSASRRCRKSRRWTRPAYAGFDSTQWLGLLAPRGTPRSVQRCTPRR